MFWTPIAADRPIRRCINELHPVPFADDGDESACACRGSARYLVARGVVLKKKWGRLKQDLDKNFFNLGLHTRTLIHVRKIATADL